MGFRLESGNNNEVNEAPVTSEQLSEAEEANENFDDCSLVISLYTQNCFGSLYIVNQFSYIQSIASYISKQTAGHESDRGLSSQALITESSVH